MAVHSHTKSPHSTFLKHDDYMTPQHAWADIKHIIPKDKVIWEAFYGDGISGYHLKKLGFNVIHEPIDFFENDLGEVVVSNPPFSQVPKILARLVELDKPFILIMPTLKLCTKYVREIFKKVEKLKIIIPRKRIHFVKHLNGKPVEGWKKNTCFDCFYYCWRIEGLDGITWLD